MARISDKQLRDLAKLARAQDWTVEPTRSGHIRWTHPSGKPFIISGSTMSDHRAILNLKARLRRAGLEIPR